MGVKVDFLADDWRSIRLLLPLNRHNTNPGGFMFGGSQAALADPVAALACARVFHGFAVWTRRLELDFRAEGRTDLELRFAMPLDIERETCLALEQRNRCSPWFEYGLYDRSDRLCTRVRCQVAIRARQADR